MNSLPFCQPSKSPFEMFDDHLVQFSLVQFLGYSIIQWGKNLQMVENRIFVAAERGILPLTVLTISPRSANLWCRSRTRFTIMSIDRCTFWLRTASNRSTTRTTCDADDANSWLWNILSGEGENEGESAACWLFSKMFKCFRCASHIAIIFCTYFSCSTNSIHAIRMRMVSASRKNPSNGGLTLLKCCLRKHLLTKPAILKVLAQFLRLVGSARTSICSIRLAPAIAK